VNAQVPGGGSLYWPYNWQGATRSRASAAPHRRKLSAGIELIEGVKIGASLNYVRITRSSCKQINYLAHAATRRSAWERRVQLRRLR